MSNNKKLNIRQAINLSDRETNLVVLERFEIVSPAGNLTELGRRIQGDLIFRGGKGDMDEIVEAVLASIKAEKEVNETLAV